MQDRRVGDLPSRCGAGHRRRGKVVSPGFVDIHTHNDLRRARRLRAALRAIRGQGITTSVVSNCGWSVAPWLPDLRSLPLRPADHGRVRDFEPGWETVKEFNGWMLGRGLPINFVALRARPHPHSGHGNALLQRGRARENENLCARTWRTVAGASPPVSPTSRHVRPHR